MEQAMTIVQKRCLIMQFLIDPWCFVTLGMRRVPSPSLSCSKSHNMFYQELPSQLIDMYPQISTTVLVLALITACLLCLRLMFMYLNNIRTEGLHQQQLFDIVKTKRHAELYPQFEAVDIKRRQLEEERLDLTDRLHVEQNDEAKKQIQAELYELSGTLKQLTDQLEKIDAKIDDEASKYASANVPARMNWSNSLSPYFYVEFGTVIIIIFALLILAIMNIVTGQEAVPIMAAIVGYVLGKATSKLQESS
jgi:hypothetical protein